MIILKTQLTTEETLKLPIAEIKFLNQILKLQKALTFLNLVLVPTSIIQIHIEVLSLLKMSLKQHGTQESTSVTIYLLYTPTNIKLPNPKYKSKKAKRIITCY